MRSSISNTAEYGDYTSGPKIISSDVKEKMKTVLLNIQNGNFANQWLEENKSGATNFKRYREEESSHPIEDVGRYLREQMSISQNKKTISDE